MKVRTIFSRLRYIVVNPMILASLLLSCAPVGYDFIGKWNRKPGTLTYINYDQHIKLTFPGPQWRVYTWPSEDDPFRWVVPTRKGEFNTVLEASSSVAFMGLYIHPFAGISLHDYLATQLSHDQFGRAAATEDFENVELESKVIQRSGREIGTFTLRAQVQGTLVKVVVYVVKEKNRMVLFYFGAPEVMFENWQDQFWALFDSWESIERPKAG